MPFEKLQQTAILTGILLVCRLSIAQTPTIATPLHSHSPAQRFPRVSGLTDTSLQAKINLLLKKREEDDRRERIDCIHARLPGGSPTSYDEVIRVSYFSSRLLSIDTTVSMFCGTYPIIDMHDPITIDLAEGAEIDWTQFFGTGFLDPKLPSTSNLLSIYLGKAKLDQECRDDLGQIIQTDSGPRLKTWQKLKFDLWLSAARGALIVKPNLPHVIGACAIEVAIPFAEIVADIRDPLDRQDLLSSKNGSRTQTVPVHRPLSR